MTTTHRPSMGIVSFSDLGKAGRMDAKFHLAAKAYAAPAARIASKMYAVDSQAMLSSLPTNALAVVEPLARGQAEDRPALLRTAMEYPALSLAMIQAEVDFEGMHAQAQQKANEAARLAETMRGM